MNPRFRESAETHWKCRLIDGMKPKSQATEMSAMSQGSINKKFGSIAFIHSTMAIIIIATPPGGHPAASSAADEHESIVIKSQSCDDVIRNRLLFKLGIYNPNFTNASIQHKIRLATIKDNTCSSTSRRHQQLQLESQEDKIPDPEDVVMSSSSWFDEHESSYLVPLKLGRDFRSTPPPPSSLLGLWSIQQQQQQQQQHSSFSSPNELHADDDDHHQRPVYVHFNSSVTVIPIPSRSYDHIAHHDQLYSCTKKKSSCRRSHYDKAPAMRSGIGLLLEEAGMNNI
jgi:hypothetical protein